VPSLMMAKRSKQHFKYAGFKTLLQTKSKMETQRVTPIEERAEVVQDVIDRLLYLSPEDVKTYRQLLNALNEQYAVDVKIEQNGLRTYSLNKNLQ
jgi:hypothetical protein